MEDTLLQVVKIKRITYNKERYEANKDYILKYRKIETFCFLAGKCFLAGVLEFGANFEFWWEFWVFAGVLSLAGFLDDFHF